MREHIIYFDGGNEMNISHWGVFPAIGENLLLDGVRGRVYEIWYTDTQVLYYAGNFTGRG